MASCVEAVTWSRACTHKGADVGFEGLSGNRSLDRSITGFDPERTYATSEESPAMGSMLSSS